MINDVSVLLEHFHMLRADAVILGVGEAFEGLRGFQSTDGVIVGVDVGKNNDFRSMALYCTQWPRREKKSLAAIGNLFECMQHTPQAVVLLLSAGSIT